MLIDRSIEFMETYRKFAIPLIFGIIFLLILFFAWNAPPHRYGDSSTYFLQIASIAEDGDIRYTAADFNRIPEYHFDDLPAGMELIKNSQGTYYYGKEFTYALFAAPFFKLGGIPSILLFNGLQFFLMIVMGYIILQKENNFAASITFSVLFFALSAAFVYIFWITPEIYSMFILMVSLFFTYFAYRNDDIYILFVAGIFFGIATIARIWNVFFFIPFFICELYYKRWNRAGILCLSFLLTVLLILIPFFAVTDTISFYGGNRFYYRQGPYPFEGGFNDQNEFQLTTFDNTINYLKSNPVKSIIPDNIIYVLTGYFVGRFTGIFWYYPFTLFVILSLLFWSIKPSGRELDTGKKFNSEWKILILTGIITSVLFIFIIRGWENYFGGSGAVGNRYFTLYPAFLFLLGKLDIKKVVIFGVIASILVAPIIIEPIETSQDPMLHLAKFPYYLFPIEYPSLGSFPVGNHGYYISGVWIVELSDEEKNRENLFFLNSKTYYLFVSRQPLSNITFAVHSNPGSTISIYAKKTDYILSGNKEYEFVTLEGLIPDYQESDFYAYSVMIVPNANTVVFPIALNGIQKEDIHFLGWYTPEDWEGNGIFTRWMKKEGVLIVVRNTTGSSELSLDMLSYNWPRNIQIAQDQKPIIERKIYPGFSQLTIPLNENFSYIKFTALDEPLRPIDMPGSHSNDTRFLSFAIRDVSINTWSYGFSGINSGDFTSFSLSSCGFSL